MEIDRPDVKAEVTENFLNYEQAIVTNDVSALDDFFLNDERTVRYGVAENLYGFREIQAFRRSRQPTGLDRRLSRTIITTFGTDYATTSTLYHRDDATVGRQTQCWVRIDGKWKIVAAHVSTIPVKG